MPGRGQPKGEGPGAGGQGVLGIAAYGDLSRAGVKKGSRVECKEGGSQQERAAWRQGHRGWPSVQPRLRLG